MSHQQGDCVSFEEAILKVVETPVMKLRHLLARTGFGRNTLKTPSRIRALRGYVSNLLFEVSYSLLHLKTVDNEYS